MALRFQGRDLDRAVAALSLQQRQRSDKHGSSNRRDGELQGLRIELLTIMGEKEMQLHLTEPPGFRDLQLQRNINQSLRIEGGVAILTNHRNFPANLTDQWRRLELTSTNYLPPYFCFYYFKRLKHSCSMYASNVSHNV